MDNRLSKFPDSLFSSLIKLKTLTLYNNNLMFLPPSLSHLTNLKELYLSQNPFMWIPKEIGNLINLAKLIMTFTHITRVSPDYIITNLTNLQFLNLSHNRLHALPLTLLNMNIKEFYAIENPYIKYNKRICGNKFPTLKEISSRSVNSFLLSL